MIILELKKHHFDEIGKLEERIYPEGFQLGTEDFLQDFNTKDGFFAYGVFLKGEMKGYLTGYRLENTYYSKTIYISDLACENPILLKSLLVHLYMKKFSLYYNLNIVKFKCECRSTSYRILKNLEGKGAIEILEDNFHENYYEDEDMREITFKLKDVENIISIKDRIFNCLLSYHGKTIDFIILRLLENDITLDEIIENKKWILRRLNEINLEKALFLGDSLKFVIVNKAFTKNIDKNVNCLAEKGYEVCTQNIIPPTDFHYYSKNYKDIKEKEVFVDKYAVDSVYYSKKIERKLFFKYTASDYRSQVMSKMKELKKMYTNMRGFYLYDKYGEIIEYYDIKKVHHYNIIPYYFKNLFDYAINKQRFINKIDNESILKSPYFSEHGLKKGYVNIRRALGEKMALEIFYTKNKVIDTHHKEHDYFYLVDELLSPEYMEYLTKGAIYKVLISYSINNISKVTSMLSNLRFPDRFIMKNLDKKYMRKEVSKLLKKDNIEGAVNLVNGTLDKITAEYNKNSSKRLLGKAKDMLPAFLERMNRYTNGSTINFNHLTRVLNKKDIKSIILGTHSGLFTPKTYYLNKMLGLELKQLFSTSEKSKKLKKLYHLLNQIKPINAIFNGDITSDEMKNIYGLLKMLNFDITNNIEITNRLYAKVEEKCSPEYLIAGNASVCCMSFGNDNAIDYAREKGFGIINFYYNDRVIANSVIWINDTYNSLVIDNIEVAPNYKKEDILKCLKSMYIEISTDLLKEYNLNFAVQGINYNDLKLYSGNESISTIVNARDVKIKNFYTDAKYCMPVEIDSLNINYLKVKEKIEAKNKEITLALKQPKQVEEVNDWCDNLDDNCAEYGFAF